jgi:hypothetical protein
VGFPIRTSADRGLVDGSPQLFAVTHVLHRFLAPRHPPLALRSLERTKLFVRARRTSHVQDARACSAVLKVRNTDACGARASSTQWRHTEASRSDSFKTEEKTDPPAPPTREDKSCDHDDVDDEPTSAPTGMSKHRAISRSPTVWNGLLRKEVIQPHLPVRLPCYDFTPITDPTFDGSLSCELGHRLRVLPTFVV